MMPINFENTLQQMDPKSDKSMLVFSIALNGYQWMYRNHIASHSSYAHRIGAQYVLIDRPVFTTMGTECCWLKLLLIKQALLKGYKTVLFLDADAMVAESAPDIRQNLSLSKHIYMAKGKTNRLNSGVMLLQNHAEAMSFINEVIQRRHHPVPSDCEVGWGENGHVIQVAKQYDSVAELDLIWNNTWRPELNDHIRHFNFGIMRDQLDNGRWLNLSHWGLARVTNLINKFAKLQNSLKLSNHQTQSTLEKSTLQNLLNITLKSYPRFF